MSASISTPSPPRPKDPPEKSLLVKIAEAQVELGDLPKDREVNTGRYTYRYVTEDAITTALRRILSPKGVAVFVSWIGAVRDGDMTTVTGEITFADDTGSFTIGVLGTGSDSGDKGLSKAQTTALRIGLCKTFLQAGDDDGESVANPRSGSSEKQQTHVRPKLNPRWEEAVEKMGEAKAREILKGAAPEILFVDEAWKRYQLRMKDAS